MLNYDFLLLSPFEFEQLTRDLIQKRDKVIIESFTTGRDGGIDSRYKIGKTKFAIIQSKRYKDFNSLKAILKKEVANVKALKPKKYIISTSAGLTPDNKTEILKLFFPYILSTDDILGKDDLNNLLGLYSDIEHKYYKLWLSSTNILEKILHSKIYNQSAYELGEINTQLRLYVQNDSFHDALKILSEHRYIIISGIPGIGKTTLSRVLIMSLLSKDIEDFIYLSDNINDAYKFYDDTKKQVYFFDDFLGSNFFQAKGVQNNDNSIVRFINLIKNSKNKYLILATREYILNQAMQVYEAFKIHDIEIAKCVLDLSSYTNLIKAQILYNHLFFANIPNVYLTNLIIDKKYLGLVKHKNYNPRIIETVINGKIWNSCEPNNFYDNLMSFFDNPESIWRITFENLDKLSQYTLLVLSSLGPSVLKEDLERALIEFIKIYGNSFQIPYDPISFKRSLEALEDTFIKTEKDSYTGIKIEYKNPSVQDFLVNYLRDNKDLINSVLNSTIFYEQFIKIFSVENNESKHRIILTKAQLELIYKRLENNATEIESSSIYKSGDYKSDTFSWRKETDFYYQFLLRMYSNYAVSSKIKKSIIDKLYKRIYITDCDNSVEQEAYVNLLRLEGNNLLEIDKLKVVEALFSRIFFMEDIDNFMKMRDIFPDEYNEFIGYQYISRDLKSIINDEIDRVESNTDVSDFIENLYKIEDHFNIELSFELSELEFKQTEYEEYVSALEDDDAQKIYREGIALIDDDYVDEFQVIDEIFSKLIEEKI